MAWCQTHDSANCLIALKLDGVGPVDNRLSTDEFHHFVLTVSDL